MLNKVFLIGNLGQDAEHTTTESSRSRAVLNVATNRTWRDADGNRKKSTDWHRVVAFGPSADFARSLEKGQQIHVEGRLQTRRFEQDGETRYITEVIVDRLLRLGPKPDAEDEPEPAEPES